MRSLSKRTKYGLQALVALARVPDGKPLLIADLAGQERLPLKFLEVILCDLKSSGYLVSRKGRGGGYALARPASQIRMGDVIRQLEGPLAPLPCASVTGFEPCGDCQDPATCRTRLLMREVRDAVASVLDNKTLADVAQSEAPVNDESLMYYI